MSLNSIRVRRYSMDEWQWVGQRKRGWINLRVLMMMIGLVLRVFINDDVVNMVIKVVVEVEYNVN